MKKVTMKDFRWLGKPERWEKTYRELSLTVGGMLSLPEGPLLLAVSDEDFILSFTTTVAPEGGFCGLCLYHSDQSFMAVGRSKTSLLIETSVQSYKTTAQIPLPTDETIIHWSLERTRHNLKMGYLSPSGKEMEWVCTSSMPGMGGAISFGPFFSNYTDMPFEAGMHSLRYAKIEPLALYPLV